MFQSNTTTHLLHEYHFTFQIRYMFRKSISSPGEYLVRVKEGVMKVQYTISQHMFHTIYGRNIKHSATDTLMFLKKTQQWRMLLQLIIHTQR